MPGPKTKNWSALENEHKPSGLHLIVSGLVEVEPDQAPMLTERPGDIPEVLQLELGVGNSSDPDFKGKVWKQARFHKEVSANQYNTVRVRWQDFITAEFPVLDDRERSRLLDKQAAAQNKVAGKASPGKPKAAAAEKVVDKAVEAVKGAVKRVAKTITRTVTGKGSKKAAKKTTKKVGKKSAKRAAKKTAKKSARRPAKKYADRPGKKTAKKTKAVRRPARKAKRR